MKIKIKDVLDMKEIIDKISNIKINSIIAYKIAKISKNLASEVETIEEIRIKTISPFIEKNEDGSLMIDNERLTYVVKEGIIDELNSELNNFFNLETDIDLPILKLDDLKDIELTTREINILLPIIEE